MKSEELGNKDENGVYTQVAFTERLAKMARAAKIHKTTSSIVTVCKTCQKSYVKRLQTHRKTGIPSRKP